MRVALFITCIGDTILPEIGRATVEMLERLGHEVVFPEEQTCCGQLHANSGYAGEATALARRFVRVFAGYEAVVAPSSSCVGMVRTVYPELARAAGDDELQRRVDELAPRVFELSELLVDRLGVTRSGRASRAGSPTTRPATPSASPASATRRPACSRRSTASSWSSCRPPRNAAASAAPSRSRTPRPRPRCWTTSAGRSSRPGPASARRSTPPACSRSAAGSSASAPVCAPSTWPRSSRRR